MSRRTPEREKGRKRKLLSRATFSEREREIWYEVQSCEPRRWTEVIKFKPMVNVGAEFYGTHEKSSTSDLTIPNLLFLFFPSPLVLLPGFIRILVMNRFPAHSNDYPQTRIKDIVVVPTNTPPLMFRLICCVERKDEF